MDSAKYLKKLCKKQDTRFIENEPDTDSWIFEVDFSKYGPEICNDDDDDDGNEKIKQDTLTNNNLNKNKSEIDITKCTLMKSTFFNTYAESNSDDNICNYELSNSALIIDKPEITCIQEYILPPLKISSCIADIILFKGSSFKVGWTKELTMLCLTKYENKSFNYEYNLVSIQKLNILHEELFKNVEQHLECQYKHSVINQSTDIPYSYSYIGSNKLYGHLKITQDLVIDNYEKQIWNLIAILFDYSIMEYSRKTKLCLWIKSIVDNTVESEVNSCCDNLCKIFSYISGYKINEAANLAVESNNFNLAMLISQLPCSKISQVAIQTQLNTWKSCDGFNYINDTVLKMYALIAGNTNVSRIFDGMDWMRILGIFLWYIIKREDPIHKAVELYEEMIIKNNNDLRFQIIKYYSKNSKYPIENILNTCTYTNDLLDYRLSWFVFQTLESLSQTQMSNETKTHMHIHFACQLEQIGLWHWAIYILTYIKNNIIKKELIKDIIGRHVLLQHEETSDYIKREKMLIEKFHISYKLIENQKAIKSMQIGYSTNAVYYSLFAEKWKNANDFAMRYFITSQLLTDNYEHLINILDPISQHKSLLPDWNETGGLILDFSKLSLQFKNISLNETNLQQLIGIKKSVVLICMRMKHFKPLTYLHEVCLAKMCGILAIMLRKLINVVNGNSYELGIATAINAQTLPITSDNLKQELNAILIENLYDDNKMK